MTGEDARQRLETVLDREIEAARQLAATLAAERGALTGPSAGALAHCAEEKIAVLNSLELLDSERQRLCDAAAIRLPPAQPAVKADAFDELAALPRQVGERWQALMELMAQCRESNDINGYIVNVRRRQVHQLIDIVRGGEAVTYGPEGKTFAKALRALARA